MTDATLQITPTPLWLRVFYAVPVFGWIVRDTREKGIENLYYGLFLLGSLWAIAIMTLGYPAIIIPALAAVPVMIVMLILISWPSNNPGT